MIIRLSLAACAALSLFCLPASVLTAQQNIVIVDMGRIFREHRGFKAAIDGLQKQVDQFKVTIQADRTKIQSESEALAGMDRNSVDYKNKESALAKMAADMQVNHNMKNREFMEKEAKLYYGTYVEILQAVQSFCRHNNITLVIRYSGEKMDPENRASVLAGVNSVVVFHERRDITEEIIKMVNRESVANQNTGGAPR